MIPNKKPFERSSVLEGLINYLIINKWLKINPVFLYAFINDYKRVHVRVRVHVLLHDGVRVAGSLNRYLLPILQ